MPELYVQENVVHVLTRIESIVNLHKTGAAQPGLSVKNLQEIQIIMVPLAEQDAIAKFFELVDKSKVAVQKALDETKMPFDSLMQEYFG